MEKSPIENQPVKSEFSPEQLGQEFSTMKNDDFIDLLHRRVKKDPAVRFNIVADWVSMDKARAAKAILEIYGTRFHIDSITIRATRQQHEEDVNAFMSGVKWEEIKSQD